MYPPAGGTCVLRSINDYALTFVPWTADLAGRRESVSLPSAAGRPFFANSTLALFVSLHLEHYNLFNGQCSLALTRVQRKFGAMYTASACDKTHDLYSGISPRTRSTDTPQSSPYSCAA